MEHGNPQEVEMWTIKGDLLKNTCTGALYKTLKGKNLIFYVFFFPGYDKHVKGHIKLDFRHLGSNHIYPLNLIYSHGKCLIESSK